MKRLYVLGIMLMTIIMGHANPTIEMKGDTLVITVKADGDLAVSNFSEEQKNSTNVKIITTNGGYALGSVAAYPHEPIP